VRRHYFRPRRTIIVARGIRSRRTYFATNPPPPETQGGDFIPRHLHYRVSSHAAIFLPFSVGLVSSCRDESSRLVCLPRCKKIGKRSSFRVGDKNSLKIFDGLVEDGLNYEYLQLALGSGELLRVASAYLVLRQHHPTTGKILYVNSDCHRQSCCHEHEGPGSDLGVFILFGR